jgi:hypothetical protein
LLQGSYINGITGKLVEHLAASLSFSRVKLILMTCFAVPCRLIPIPICTYVVGLSL